MLGAGQGQRVAAAVYANSRCIRSRICLLGYQDSSTFSSSMSTYATTCSEARSPCRLSSRGSSRVADCRPLGPGAADRAARAGLGTAGAWSSAAAACRQRVKALGGAATPNDSVSRGPLLTMHVVSSSTIRGRPQFTRVAHATKLGRSFRRLQRRARRTRPCWLGNRRHRRGAPASDYRAQA